MYRQGDLPDDFNSVEELDYGEDEPEIPESIDFLVGASAPDDPGSNSAPILGPAMPPEIYVGPSLPNDDDFDPPPEPSSRSIGPALPPHLMHLNDNSEEEEEEESEQEVELYGPAIPPPDGGNQEEEDDNDDDQEVDFGIIGPLPPGADEDDKEREAEEYALRRLAYEEEKEANKNTSKREEWMVQLPKKLTNYGLGARTFSKGGGGEKDDSWTDTPGQKKRKLDEAGTSSGMNAAILKSRDEEQERIAEQLNQSRQESLLDSHQGNRARATNGVSTSGARRPFDREKDMEVRGLKNASTDEIKQKCGNLGSRFGSSTQQKFL